MTDFNNNIPYKTFKGVKWYYRLIDKEMNNKIYKGLFSFYPRDTLLEKLLVRMTYYDIKSKKNLLLYTIFKSYIDFGIYSLKFPLEKRSFYEIILGEFPQKPHFDIDIEKNENICSEEVKDDLLSSLINVLNEKGIDLILEKDILIYTSHGNTNDGKYKYSYHIVINNYAHVNNTEAKLLYEKVKENMKVEFQKYLDSAVYSPTQQFRMIGSSKLGENRIKKFERKWYFKGKEIIHIYPENLEDDNHEFVMQLEESIVGARKGNCLSLPIFQPEHLKEDIKKSYEIIDEDVSRKDALDALQLLADKANVKINNRRFPYRISGISGPIIMLKRIKPSICRICKRIHEHENPYLVVLGEEKNVYFDCRRASDDKKYFVGKLENVMKELENDIEKDDGEKEKEEKDKTKNNISINWTKETINRLKKVAKSDKGVKAIKIKQNLDKDTSMFQNIL